jgi:hypothetical protein
MKWVNWIDSFTYLELFEVLFFIFILFAPIQPSRSVAFFFDSSLGMAVLFFITIFLFMGTHPIIGVLFLFVAYEILRRSSLVIQHVPILRMSENMDNYIAATNHNSTVAPLIKEGGQPLLSVTERDSKMSSMNPPHSTTLEEEIVSTHVPMNSSSSPNSNTFLPVVSSHIPASLFK